MEHGRSGHGHLPSPHASLRKPKAESRKPKAESRKPKAGVGDREAVAASVDLLRHLERPAVVEQEVRAVDCRGRDR